MNTGKILVGVIKGAHGLKGEVRIKAFTETPQNLLNYGIWSLRSGETLRLNAGRIVKGGEVIARLENITDRTAAENLRGFELYIDRCQLPEAEQGSYYHHDLIFMDVYTENEVKIGQVIAVQNYGASDILEVQVAPNQNVMVPFIDDAIETVDPVQQKIIVRAAFVI